MSTQYVTCALYKFVALPHFGSLRAPLLKTMTDNNVFGTLLLAAEGINGTVSGTRENIDLLLHWIGQQAGLDNIDTKESYDDTIPFYRSKVKLKKEKAIVTFTQNYKSGALNQTSPKTLVLVEEDSRWLILEEISK